MLRNLLHVCWKEGKSRDTMDDNDKLLRHGKKVAFGNSLAVRAVPFELYTFELRNTSISSFYLIRCIKNPSKLNFFLIKRNTI